MASSHRQFIHNVEYFEILDIFRVQVEEYFDLISVVDNPVLVEDTFGESLPESLSGLVLKYNLYDTHFSRKQGARGGQILNAAHNARDIQ